MTWRKVKFTISTVCETKSNNPLIVKMARKQVSVIHLNFLIFSSPCSLCVHPQAVLSLRLSFRSSGV